MSDEKFALATSAESILAAEDRGMETVPVPEWNMAVLVLGMTGRQRDRFEASLLEKRGKVEVPNVDNIRAKVCAWCIVGADQARLFTDDQAEALGNKSGAAIDRIYKVAARLSGISDSDVDELQTALLANPTGSPSSPSPNGSDAPPASSSTESPPGRSASGLPSSGSNVTGNAPNGPGNPAMPPPAKPSSG